jgi:MFS family permease
MSTSSASSSRMSAPELRATVSLASVFALRMLGLFMTTPVFSVYAKTIPGGNDTVLVGIALGVYGVTQAALYILYGRLSDRFGRKRVIVAGLAIFALCGAVAALAHNTHWIIVGRALQGGSIGISFAVAIVGAPVLFSMIGMSGLFSVIGALSVAAMGVVLWVVPDPPSRPVHVKAPFAEVLHNPDLLRMNFGVFALHATQTALFVVVPRVLEASGLPVASHWKIYLPVMAIAFVLMVPAIIVAEKRGCMKAVILSAIVAILIGQVALAELGHTMMAVAAILLVYFTGFNVLEASQPSMVSKLAPGTRKGGAAMGVYNTTQALGLALGGAMGGWLLKVHGDASVFLACSALVLAWLVIAAPMKVPARGGTHGAH